MFHFLISIRNYPACLVWASIVPKFL